MKVIARARRYDNSLRQEQAEHTAQRILDAVYARVSKGDRDVSYAAVAREAGVSVPTVYRHFPTVDDIFRAFAAREREKHGEVPMERSALPHIVHSLFARFDDPDDLFRRNARLSHIWQFSRVGTVPERRAYFDKIVLEAAPRLTSGQHTRIVDACVVVLSSAMGEAFAGYLELDGAAMADRALLILEALLAHAAQLSAASRAPKSTPRKRP